MTIPPVMHEAFGIIFHTVSLSLCSQFEVVIFVAIFNIVPIDGNILISIRSGLNMPKSKGVDDRDEFGPKISGPDLKWAMKIMARPGHGPKPMLAFGPGRALAKFKIDGPGWAGPKFENILKNITFSLVFQFKIATYDVFHTF